MTGGVYQDEPAARVGISRILEKVTQMESVMAVQACAIQALVENVKELRTSVGLLEASRMPWGKLTAIAGVMGAVVAVVALFVKTA